MQRFYLLPMEVVGKARGPKYFDWRYDPDPPGIGCRWSLMAYGLMPNGLLLAHDISAADDAYLAVQTDVYAWPLNLDQAIPGNDPLRTFFEGVNVPTDWLTAATTYRELLRCLAGMFQFAQRYQGISGQALFDATVSLNSRYRDMSAQQQAWFTQTAQSFGYALTINPNRTLRQLAKQAGDAWGSSPFYMGGVEF